MVMIDVNGYWTVAEVAERDGIAHGTVIRSSSQPCLVGKIRYDEEALDKQPRYICTLS